MEAPVGTSVIENISLSDPLKIYDYERYAFITFVNEALTELALKYLKGVEIKATLNNGEGQESSVIYRLNPVKANIRQAEPLMTPPQQPD